MLINDFELKHKMLLQNLEQDDITKFCDMFGIEKSDFMVYMAAYQNPELTVAKIAGMLDMDRGKVYRTVDRLDSLGFVSKTISNPARLSAIDPELIIKQIVEKHENSIKLIDRKYLDDFFLGMKKKVNTPTLCTTSYITGTDNYLARINIMLQECEFARMYLSETTLKRIYYSNVPDTIKKKKKNIVILASDLKLVRRLSPGKMKKCVSAIDNDIVVTDKAVIFEAGAMNSTGSVKSFYYNSDDANYLYTTNRFLIHVGRGYIENLND